MAYSPALSGRKAVSSSKGLEEVLGENFRRDTSSWLTQSARSAWDAMNSHLFQVGRIFRGVSGRKDKLLLTERPRVKQVCVSVF
jgi:hypothetical protein